jgi:hypothetical protein
MKTKPKPYRYIYQRAQRNRNAIRTRRCQRVQSHKGDSWLHSAWPWGRELARRQYKGEA